MEYTFQYARRRNCLVQALNPFKGSYVLKKDKYVQEGGFVIPDFWEVEIGPRNFAEMIPWRGNVNMPGYIRQDGLWSHVSHGIMYTKITIEQWREYILPIRPRYR